MRVLQLTDMHIAADRERVIYGIKPWYTWQAVWHDVQQRYQDQYFDLIVLSGDLSEDGSEASYQYIVDTLSSISSQVMYLPGNHDDYGMMQKVFSAYGLSANRLWVDQDWIVIGMNTQVVGKAYGNLASTELAWLQNCLEQYTHHQVLIVTHHHLLKVGSFGLDRIRLKNAKLLLNTIDAYPNIRAVIQGHVHQASVKLRNQVWYFTTPATCIQYKPQSWRLTRDQLPPGYRVIECGAAVTARVVYVAH